MFDFTALAFFRWVALRTSHRFLVNADPFTPLAYEVFFAILKKLSCQS